MKLIIKCLIKYERILICVYSAFFQLMLPHQLLGLHTRLIPLIQLIQLLVSISKLTLPVPDSRSNSHWGRLKMQGYSMTLRGTGRIMHLGNVFKQRFGTKEFVCQAFCRTWPCPWILKGWCNTLYNERDRKNLIQIHVTDWPNYLNNFHIIKIKWPGIPASGQGPCIKSLFCTRGSHYKDIISLK